MGEYTCTYYCAEYEDPTEAYAQGRTFFGRFNRDHHHGVWRSFVVA
jgi:hypothetical protein